MVLAGGKAQLFYQVFKDKCNLVYLLFWGLPAKSSDLVNRTSLIRS